MRRPVVKMLVTTTGHRPVAHENKRLFVFSAEMKSLFHFMHARFARVTRY